MLKTWAKDAVRLVGGPSARMGRVEVYYSEAWGAVCGENWDMVDATVVCKMLGYGGASAHLQNISLEQENDTEWLSGVHCTGNESSLTQCAHTGWGKHTCNITQAAGVTCFERRWDISSAIPQFISSTLDTITMMFNVPGVTLMKYTVQMWSNRTKTWRDTRCTRDNANGLCVVRALNTNVTVTGLTPGHAYYFRFVSPSLKSSQISKSMVTKQLGYATAPRFISSTKNSITITWESNTSVPTNYSVEMKCCQETTWTKVHCTENLIDQGCTVSNNTATVIGLKKDTTYYFRVYVVYSNWRSVASVSSKAMMIKSDIFPKGKIWTASLSSECVTSQVGDVITMLCHVPGETPNIYRWTKDNRTIINDSKDGVLNLTVSSADDFGLYSCHVINSEGNAIYNITICQRTSLKEKVTQDSMNSILIAIITTSFICFGIFIVVLILLKMVQIYRRRKKQSKEAGREEMAMLHYRQKSFRSGNNNEEELDLNT